MTALTLRPYQKEAIEAILAAGDAADVISLELLARAERRGALKGALR